MRAEAELSHVPLSRNSPRAGRALSNRRVEGWSRRASAQAVRLWVYKPAAKKESSDTPESDTAPRETESRVRPFPDQVTGQAIVALIVLMSPDQEMV